VKSSAAPETGDLVQHILDLKNGFACVGLVLECRGIDCKVLWNSPSEPMGWWRRDQLKVLRKVL